MITNSFDTMFTPQIFFNVLSANHLNLRIHSITPNQVGLHVKNNIIIAFAQRYDDTIAIYIYN